MRAIKAGGTLGKCVFCSHTLSETKDLRNKHAKIKAGKWICGACLLDLKEASFEVFFAYEEEEAELLEEKLRKNTFDFTDFQDQLGRIRKMGGRFRITSRTM